MKDRLMLQLAVLFIATQLLGLYVAQDLIKADVKAELFTENSEDVENAVGLFAYIIVFTIIFLAAIKFMKAGILFKAFEALAIFGTGIIVFSTIPLVNELALMFAVLLVILRNVLRESLALKNFAAMIAVAGAGSLIGVSLGIFPVLVFVILLSAYDIIAVFFTKHMVEMAKGITEQNVAFTFSLPTEKHVFQLGTGDLVIPLVFSVSAMNSAALKGIVFPNFLIPGILILTASLIGLILTLEFARRKEIALPALPPQAVLMIIAWMISAAILG